MINQKLFTGLIILLLCFSCKSNQSNSAVVTGQKQDTIVNTTQDKRILFLEYTVYSLGEDSIGASKNREYIAKGTLKTANSLKNSLVPKNITFVQYTNNEIVLDNTTVPNPFSKSVEFVDEVGQLGRKTINMDSTSVFVRLDLKKETKTVRMYYVKSDGIQFDLLDELKILTK
jgi:hypothetical protein